jgi:TIR domain
MNPSSSTRALSVILTKTNHSLNGSTTPSKAKASDAGTPLKICTVEKKLHEQIDEAIRVYDKLLLILSEHSMNSEWVKTEIANARRREVTEHKRLLFPIRLVDFEVIRTWKCFDADTGKDSAREIREYFIPDFSNWKDHDSFEQAFTRLLQDLKADETPTST